MSSLLIYSSLSSNVVTIGLFAVNCMCMLYCVSLLSLDRACSLEIKVLYVAVFFLNVVDVLFLCGLVFVGLLVLMVYAGTVLVLFVIVLMYTGDLGIDRVTSDWLVVALVGVGCFIGVVFSVDIQECLQAQLVTSIVPNYVDYIGLIDTCGVGHPKLIGQYLFSFAGYHVLVLGLCFFMCIIGVLHVAMRKEPKK